MATKLPKVAVNNFPETLIIGGSGLVGSKVLELFGEFRNKIQAPSSQELDITKNDSVDKFIGKSKPQVIINFAAYTNLAEAEKERGNKSGAPWELNVSGVKNIIECCQTRNIFYIHISTDGVFPGTKEFPGPYSEKATPPHSLKHLSWYGYTKLLGEEEVKRLGNNYAIVRISHPFGNPKSERDFIIKVREYIKIGYVLFSDQIFTPTYIEDIANALLVIVTRKKTGTFHVACNELTTPFEFASYLSSKLKLQEEVKEGSLVDFMKVPGRTPKAKLGGLLTRETQRLLKLKFHTWKKAVDRVAPNISGTTSSPI